eukprot:779384-Amphidinium_carterae.4
MPLRFRIAVGKFIDFNTEYTTERTIDQIANVNNRSDEDLSRLKSAVLSDHDTILGSHHDLKAVSQSLAQSSQDGSQGFSGTRSFLNDGLQALCPSAEKLEEDEEEDDGEEESEQDDEGLKGGSGSKVKWYDLPGGIAKAKRMTAIQLQKLEQSLQQAITSHTNAVAEVAKLPVSLKDTLQSEIAIVDVRVGAIRRVLSDQELEFKDATKRLSKNISEIIHDYLRTFDVTMGSTAPTKGTGPPCREYLDLQPLVSLQSHVGSFENCENKAGVENVKKLFAASRKPLGGLLSSFNSARNELLRAAQQLLKDHKTKMLSKDLMGARARNCWHYAPKDKASSTSSKSLTVSLFEIVAEHALEIPVLRMVSDPRPKGLPYILPKDALMKEIDTASAADFHKPMALLESQVKKAAETTDVVRASRTLDDDVAKALTPFMHTAAPERQMELPMTEAMAKLLQPSVFCMSASSTISCQASNAKMGRAFSRTRLS